MSVSLRGKEIVIKFAYNSDILNIVRNIYGRKWDAASRVWTVPASPWHSRLVQSRLGNVLEIDRDVVRLADRDQRDWNHSTLDLSLDNGFAPYPYQAGAVEFLHKIGGRGIISDEVGCIDGDAEIVVNRAGRGLRIKLHDLYNKIHGSKSGNRSWDLSIPTMTRSVNENTGALRLNKIVDVLDKGVRECVEITLESSKKLRLTPDHEVYTNDGWKEAATLQVGSVVYTNGKPVCVVCGSTDRVITYKHARFPGYCRPCMYEARGKKNGMRGSEDGYVRVFGCYFHPYARKNGVVLEHRLSMEAYLNGVSLSEWIIRCHTGYELGGMTFLPPEMSVHHKDGMRDHNDPSNLEVLNSVDHGAVHGNPNRLTEFMSVKEDRVVSVVPCGLVHVYDVVMDDPHHSFVANGIVVHNCGKTIELLSFIRYKKITKFLVVVPASILYKWEREIGRWYPEMEGKTCVITTTKTKITGSAHVISYDMLTRRVMDLTGKYDMICFDECVRLKNHQTQRAKAAKSICKGTPYVIGMSGTPILNRPRELFNILNIIDDCTWTWFDFFNRYCGNKEIGYNGAFNLPELEERLHDVMIRRFKRDVQDQLPPITRTVVPVVLEDDLMATYRKLVVEDPPTIRALYPQGKGYFDNKLDWLSAIRQFLERARVNAVAQWVEDFLESSERRKIVVYCGFKSTIHYLEDYLSAYGTLAITGDVPNKKRQEIIDRWQNSMDERVMLLTSAGGEGIDLFGKGGIDCSTIVFAGREWSPATEEQIEGRLDRTGQSNAVEAVYLVAQDTVDVDIHKFIERKREVIKSAIRIKDVDTVISDLVDLLARRGIVKKEKHESAV